MVDLHQTTQITRNQLAYKCGWSPFEGEEFQAKILKTFVNGNLVYNEGKINLINNGKRLTFNPLN
jgi:dihydroorotase